MHGPPAVGVVAGIFVMGANVLYLLAVRGGMLAVVAVVASLHPASTVALGFRIDKERLTRWQAVGLGVAALALVLVSGGCTIVTCLHNYNAAAL